MEYDTDKIDDADLALLFLTNCDDKFCAAAWKSHDWDALNRLHAKGYIGDPINKAKSVALTEDGKAKAEDFSDSGNPDECGCTSRTRSCRRR